VQFLTVLNETSKFSDGDRLLAAYVNGGDLPVGDEAVEGRSGAGKNCAGVSNGEQ
jgi:hypothetical protein